MTNNISVTEGSGKVVATEDVGGAQFQKVEIYGQGGASILAINPDGSIKASIVGSVQITGSVVVASNPNQSVSGAINISGSVLLGSSNASVFAVQTGTWRTSIVSSTPSSVLVGASIFGQLPAGTAVLGSVAALQGTNPWIINGSVSGAMNLSGSVLLGSSNASVIATIQGSVATVQMGQIGTQITSIVNTVPSSVIVGASIFGQLPSGTGVIGSVAVLQGTNPWQVSGSVSGALNLSGSVLLGSSNASVIAVIQGSTAAAQIGTIIASVVSSTPSSMLVGASIFGQLPAGTAVLGSVAVLQGTTPWINTNTGSIITIQVGSVITTNVGSIIAVIQGSSLIGVVTGSVATVFQGSVLTIPTSSTITVWKDSSVLAVPVGSYITVFQAPSIVGTYAEDSASATADKGFFMLGVRNDSMSSTTSADGDYSQWTTGPIGEGIVANAPITKWVQGTADFRSNAGASIVAIAAGGTSVFTYITGVQVANMGSASVLVTLASGGSTLGYTIAPAGGGSNLVYPNGLKTPANFGFAASLSGIASVFVSAQGFISKT